MRGLDTNVLVRYLVQDDAAQARRAAKEIEAGSDAGEIYFIADVVVCELVWVLDRAYGYSRAQIGGALEGILQTRSFHFVDKDLLWAGAGRLQKGRGDFADYVIGRVGEKSGCEKTLGFDRALKGDVRFEVL